MADVDYLQGEPIPGFTDTGSGRALVLVPGMDGASEFWCRQSDGLSGRYRVVSTGFRRRCLDPDHGISVYADDVLDIMDILGLAKAVVVGQSFGGMVAMYIALECPERVAGLVLCNTADRVSVPDLGFDRFTLATLLHALAFALPSTLSASFLDWVGRSHGFVMDPSPGNAELATYLLEHGLDPGLCGYLDRLRAAMGAMYGDGCARSRYPRSFCEEAKTAWCPRRSRMSWRRRSRARSSRSSKAAGTAAR